MFMLSIFTLVGESLVLQMDMGGACIWPVSNIYSSEGGSYKSSRRSLFSARGRLIG